MAAKDTQIPNFTRDTTLSADIADSFGGGSARAEQLIQANQARFSDDLNEANLFTEDVEARGTYSEEDVEKAADMPEGSVKGVTKRGNFLTYVYEVNGRVLKDAVRIEDGKLVASEESNNSPERQALRAAAKATSTVRSAQDEAAQIIADAKEEAARLVAEAAAKAEDERQKDAQDAAKAAAKRADDKAKSE